ncbi:MAG: tRNA pseudouridine(38-40) synthase TruA [Bacteroidales bacterium]|nr:tRNA pseudouridine(38-40) synthase TruA [Bacteroidales bacterium]
MRYFIELSYDGSEFCGWQLQPNALTVQECLEETLSTLLKERVQVVGAGRTDSKVNAIGYVAHFDYDKVIDTSALGYKLNAILPRGIVIHSVREADADLHARFSAKRREYTYFLHRTKDPFIENRSYFCSWDLDVDAMNEAAALLLGTHDFRCFEKSGSDNRTSICTVTEAFWAPYSPDHVSLMGFSPAASRPDADAGSAPQYLYFRIAADRFLRNMVRAVVGSLLEVGRGRRSVADFASLLLPPACNASSTPGEANSTSSQSSSLPPAAESRHTAADGTPFRSLAGESVPGHALFLSRVDY